MAQTRCGRCRYNLVGPDHPWFCNPCQRIVARQPSALAPLLLTTSFVAFRPLIPGHGKPRICHRCGRWFRFSGRDGDTPYCSGACLKLDRRSVRAKRVDSAPGTHTEAEWIAKLAEYGGICAYCPAPATTRDHVIALACGGSDAIDNIVPACRPCNSSKNTRSVADWKGRPAVLS